MRLLKTAILLLGFWALPAHADDRVVPLEVVQQLYAKPETGDENTEIVDIPMPMSAELGDLLSDDQARGSINGTGIGHLDFDWMVNGQDAKITNLQIKRVAVTALSPDDPKREIIVAQFDNFDDPTRISYFWKYDADRGWLIEDVTGWSQDGLVWTLSLLLKYGQ